MESPKLLEPMATIGILLGVTCLFFIAKIMYQIYDYKNENPTPILASLAVYFATMVAIQIGITASNSTSKCREAQPGSTILYTLGPNLLIFGSVILILLVMPGWKSAFSNTLGYLFVCLPFLNVNTALVELLGGEKGKSTKLIEKICSNKSLVINEITPVNFNVIVPELAGKESIDGLSVVTRKALWKCIVIKDAIGDFIWYALTLAFTVLVTYDSIMDMRCTHSKAFIKSKIDDYKTKANLADE
jgi:hypothetical protein|tara:strand:+ start:3735 stop:4469 length:735 start_codon:yes stop_codon:yes gene_type:complete